jgi:hypothetical protein
VEDVFQRHMQRFLLSYQSLLDELEHRLERRTGTCVAVYTKQLDELRASQRVMDKLAR